MQYTKVFALPIGALACGYSLALNRFAHTTSNEEESVRIYLSPKSKALLSERLSALGYENYSGDSVVVHAHPKERDIAGFRTIYGQKTAFRVKNIIESNGMLAGVGRASSHLGELRHPDFEPCLPFSNSAEDKAVVDLPSRMVSQIRGGKAWEGTVKAGKVGKTKYSATRAMLKPLAWEEQIVIEGVVCSSQYMDSDGNCTYRAPESLSTDDSSVGIASDESKENQEKECPVCAFMKGGQCKDEFLSFDACILNVNKREDGDISECSDVTKKMLDCMKKYEYYDIMTAGSSY